MTSEGHSGFEDGRVSPGEAEFQVGVDDSRLDEPDARFTHEKITNGKFYAHDRTGQPVDEARHLCQVHFILEIGNLNTRQCFQGSPRGVVHSQIECTVFKSSKKILGFFYIFFRFFEFFRLFPDFFVR